MTQSNSQPDLSDISHDDWVQRNLPKAWRPYARLARLDRPVGTWLTVLPCIAALSKLQVAFPILLAYLFSVWVLC